jgi:5-formyltetrahydrofolate cyclo-ligase
MDMLRVYSEDDLNALPSGIWGIKQPELDFEGSARERGKPLDSMYIKDISDECLE